IEPVNAFEIGDSPASLLAEGMLAVERVQDYSFDQIAQRHVVIFRQSFQHLEQTLFQPYPCLDALDQNPVLLLFGCSVRHPASPLIFMYMVLWYICTTIIKRGEPGWYWSRNLQGSPSAGVSGSVPAN